MSNALMAYMSFDALEALAELHSPAPGKAKGFRVGKAVAAIRPRTRPKTTATTLGPRNLDLATAGTKKIFRLLTQVRAKFLALHAKAIEREFGGNRLGFVLIEAPISPAVAARFVESVNACLHDGHGWGASLRGGYHGTPDTNMESIFATGLRNPAKTSWISSNIPGIYSTALGSGEVSRGYCRGNPDLIVIGVSNIPTVRPAGEVDVDPNLKDPRVAARVAAGDADVPVCNRGAGKPKAPRLRRSGRGNHRDRHPPSWRVRKRAANKAATAVAQSGSLEPKYPPAIVDVNCASRQHIRVIHDEALCAPLFVARSAFPGTRLTDYSTGCSSFAPSLGADPTVEEAGGTPGAPAAGDTLCPTPARVQPPTVDSSDHHRRLEPNRNATGGTDIEGRSLGATGQEGPNRKDKAERRRLKAKSKAVTKDLTWERSRKLR